MTEHPYEIGGILFTIAIICGLLGGIAGQQMGAADFLLEIDNGVHEMASGSGSGSGGTWIGHDYEDNSSQLDCKQAINLQEFYECVND